MKSNNEKYVLSVHIGVSSRHAAILDFAGKVLFSDELHELPQVRSSKKYAALIGDALDGCSAVLQKASSNGLRREQIVGGGAVVPASVDPRCGYVRLPPGLPGLQNTQLASDLESGIRERLGHHVRFWVENDANGAALAEWYFGCTRGVSDFVVIILCTGLGGGLFLNGKLHHGHTFMAGEIGHTTVYPDGPLCPCGGKGCLETLVSGRALLRMAQASRSPLAEKENLDYASLIRAAGVGDKDVLSLLRKMGQYLGICIANVANTLNPSKIILTGYLARAAKYFKPATDEEVRMRMFAGMDCQLEISELLDRVEVLAGLSTFRYYSEGEDLSNGNPS